MNPMEMIKTFINSGNSPEQIVTKMVSENNLNPMMGNLIQMAKNGNGQEIEQFARNIFKQNGRDFDAEYKQFVQSFNNSK